MRIKIATSKPSKNVILSEAKNLGSVAPGDTNQRCFQTFA